MIRSLLKHPLTNAEVRRFIKFVLVGGTSFLIHFFIYILLSRVLFPTIDRTFLNLVAISFSVTFNFLAHRGWTYRSSEKSLSLFARYFIVISIAGAIQSVLFFIGVEIFAIYDLIVTIFVAGVSALFSFTAHRFFTFTQKTNKLP